jgi:hypothetical protein
MRVIVKPKFSAAWIVIQWQILGYGLDEKGEELFSEIEHQFRLKLADIGYYWEGEDL